MRRPGLPGMVLAVVGATAALVVLAYASRPPEQPPVTTTTLDLVVAPPAPATTTSTTASEPVTSPVTRPTLSDLLPGAEGDLISVVTTGTGTYHITAWSRIQPLVEAGMPPMINRPNLEFDVSDLRLAFLGPSSVPEGNPLYVGRPLDWRPIASRVTSFAWHSSLPGRLGWVELGRGLCQADVHVNGAFVTEPVCDLDVVGELAGLDDHGALMVDDGDVLRISPDGEETGRVPGSDATTSPNGGVLVTETASVEGETTFRLASPDLIEIEVLEWAPESAVGLYGFVAWSPRATSPELAFLVRLDADRYQIQRWDLDGNLLNALNIGGEVWDIGWDRSGRYLLAPGLFGDDYGVVVYDLTTTDLAFLPFDHWVEDTQLVIPAFCEDASALVDHWQERVPDGVAIVDMWMVSSRDYGLVSFLFVSGRLIGGAFDGEVATWAIPDYTGAGAPPQAIPANAAALNPRQEPSPLDQDAYGVDDWMLIDGARISQWCLGHTDG